MAASNPFSSLTSVRTTQTEFFQPPLHSVRPRLLAFPLGPFSRSSSSLPGLNKGPAKLLFRPLVWEGEKCVVRGSGFRQTPVRGKWGGMARTTRPEDLHVGIYGRSAKLLRPPRMTPSPCLISAQRNLAANYHKMGLSSCHFCADNPGVSQVLDIPRLPDHFRLGRKLGVGQFGEVFHATTLSNGEEIAVKCVPIPATDTHIARVKREVQILRQTSHPGVVKYIDCYMNRGKVYIGMELCRGGNLKERLDKGKMGEEEGKKLIRQVLEALVHLHQSEIVHRDIKPENILFDLEGNAKITDFGLSRMMQAAQRMTVVGTPYYLAPEIRQGFYNEKCDIWSFGVVMYFTFVGKLPFNGASIPAIVHKICTKEVTKWGEMSPGAIDFIGKMLQKNPASRPSASELLQVQWLNTPSASTSDSTLAVLP